MFHLMLCEIKKASKLTINKKSWTQGVAVVLRSKTTLSDVVKAGEIVQRQVGAVNLGNVWLWLRQ